MVQKSKRSEVREFTRQYYKIKTELKEKSINWSQEQTKNEMKKMTKILCEKFIYK